MNNVSPMQTALRYGLILALISILIELIKYITGLMTNQAASSVIGLLSLIVSIVVIVMAVKHHRDVQQNGYITLGKAFGVGILASLVSAIIGAIFLYVLHAFIDPGILEEMMVLNEERMIESGVTDEVIEMSSQLTNTFMTPVGMASTGLFGGVCCGGIIALFAGLILKKEPLSNDGAF